MTDRKKFPVATGVIDYFPRALRYVSYVSYVGNEQHNPGEKLHWAKGKSMDHDDALIRHFLDRGTMDTDDVLHTGKVAWRALAMLETELEDLETKFDAASDRLECDRQLSFCFPEEIK